MSFVEDERLAVMERRLLSDYVRVFDPRNVDDKRWTAVVADDSTMVIVVTALMELHVERREAGRS